MINRRHSASLVLVSALVLSFSLGSMHAFSVFLDPLEMKFAVSRAAIAPAYSIGLAALTVAVLVGHRMYQLVSPAVLALLASLTAACGLLITTLGANPFALWLGYGLVFGFANGVGYGFALYLTNLAFDRYRGLAMGSVTAVYAVGASVCAKLLDDWILSMGSDGVLLRLSTMLILCGLASSVCLWSSQASVSTSPPASSSARSTVELDRYRIALCWFVYGTGVAAGLMAMGHAAGIVTAVGGSMADGVRGAVAITVSNALGGFLAGYFADRRPVPILLAASGAASALALSLLALGGTATLAIISLAIIGFGYGSTIALFPILTALVFGGDAYAIAYGRIFTSWGLAGLGAPWFAGILYVQTGGYEGALLAAALLASISAGLSLLLVKVTSKI